MELNVYYNKDREGLIIIYIKKERENFNQICHLVNITKNVPFFLLFVGRVEIIKKRKRNIYIYTYNTSSRRNASSPQNNIQHLTIANIYRTRYRSFMYN